MLFICSKCRQNAAAAFRLNEEYYPRVHPNFRSFINFYQHSRETGDLGEHRGGHARKTKNICRE